MELKKKAMTLGSMMVKKQMMSMLSRSTHVKRDSSGRQRSPPPCSAQGRGPGSSPTRLGSPGYSQRTNGLDAVLPARPLLLQKVI